MPTRPVWAEISLDRLTRNYALLRGNAAAAAPHAELIAIVKANAYGHGVEACGPALAASGARWLGVTSVEEGALLRRALGVLPSHLAPSRILIMSSLWHGEAETTIDRHLTPQVWEPYQLDLLRQGAINRAVSSFPVHLEIDTGMSRQGVAPGLPLAALLKEFRGSPLKIEAVLTHFSAPERLDQPDTDTQIARFSAALDQLKAAGVHPRWIHAGNSATVFDVQHTSALAALASRSDAQLLLRPGLALYGYPVRFSGTASSSTIASVDQGGPSAQSQLQPALAWKTRISSLRAIGPGDCAGYNSIFRARRPSTLALVPIGYADGLNRLLSNPLPSTRSAMLVRGQRAPIAGRISMDQTILDVTDVPGAAVGDEVVILGEQQGANEPPQAITAWEHADLCQTIPYEILCNIAARVPRLVAG